MRNGGGAWGMKGKNGEYQHHRNKKTKELLYKLYWTRKEKENFGFGI